MLFAAYVVHKRRIVDQKNRALVKQIAEAAEYRKRYEEKIQTPPLTPPLEGREVASAGEIPAESPCRGVAVGGDITPPTTPPDAQSVDALFTHIHHVIKEKKLYLDPHFDRQAAIDHFHLTKERIGAAFAQGSEHASITDFINRLRLDHARELITTRPEMSIDEVATASGFSVRRTFSRLFKENFGLTPTEFRNAIQGSSERRSQEV